MRHPTLRDRFLDNLNTALSTYLSSQSMADAARAQLQRIQPLLPQYLEKHGVSEDKYRGSFKNLLTNIRVHPGLVLQHCAADLQLSQDEMNTRFAEAYAAIRAYEAN